MVILIRAVVYRMWVFIYRLPFSPQQSDKDRQWPEHRVLIKKLTHGLVPHPNGRANKKQKNAFGAPTIIDYQVKGTMSLLGGNVKSNRKYNRSKHKLENQSDPKA